MKSILEPWFVNPGLKHIGSVASWTTADVARLGIRSFAVVRNPLDRFVSGFSTLMKGAHGKMAYNCNHTNFSFLLDLEEPQLTDAFVDLLVSEGDAYCDRLCHCFAQHVLSITWFTNLWPGSLDLVIRQETLDVDMDKLSRWLGVKLPNNYKNKRQSMYSARLSSESESKLRSYYAIDMKRFGYT